MEQENPKRSSMDLYRSTAGEIEARDAANRRGLNAGVRKNRLPNTGDERTVFVEGDGLRYSIGENMTEDERYEELQNVTIRLAEINEDTIGHIDLSEFNTRKKSAVTPAFKKLAKKLGIVNVDLHNSEIHFPFQFSNKNLEKSLHHQLEYGGTYQDYVKAMSCFEDVVANAALIEIHPDKKRGTIRENPDLMRTYVMVGAYRDGEDTVPVQLEVKEFRERNNGLYMNVVLTKIESEVVDTGVPEEIGDLPYLFPDSTVSLRHIFENVNPADGRFLKYVPDGFLNEEQRKAKKAALDRQEKEYTSYGTKKQYSIGEPEEGGSDERPVWTAVEPEMLTGTLKQRYDRVVRQAAESVARSLNVPRAAEQPMVYFALSPLNRHKLNQEVVI